MAYANYIQMDYMFAHLDRTTTRLASFTGPIEKAMKAATSNHQFYLLKVYETINCGSYTKKSGQNSELQMT